MEKPRGINLGLGLLLRQSHQRAAGALNDALSELGLTGRHFGVMLLLYRSGMSTQRDLIAQTGSDKAGMVRTVSDLDELGLVQRTPSARDKRLAEITLTEKGREVFERARALASAAAEDLFGAFTTDELETLESLLSRFVASQPRGGEPRR